MVFRKLIIAVCVFAIFAAGAFTAFQVADLGQKDAPADPRNVTNETLVQEYDAYQFVDNATKDYTAGFDSDVTVYNNSSVELTEGTDYEWNETDGTIIFKDTAKTTELDEANVSYTYYWNTQRVREVSGPLTVITEAIGRTGLLAGGLALVVLLVSFGGIVAKRIGTSGGLPESNR
jgi:hypothetical protein